MLVCVEDPLFIAAVTGLVGLAIGIVAIMAFRFSDRTRDSTDLHSNNELPDGIAEVLAVLPSAAIVVDAGNDVIKASPAAYTFGLVRGHRIVASELAAVIDRVRNRGLIEETNFETQRGRSRQARRYLHARVAPLGAAFVLVLCDDQTDAYRLEAVRRDFVANVSHELKTPIGAIALLAEAVTDFSDDPEAVERFGGRMQRESHRLSQLVQEIIDLSAVQDHEAPSGEIIPVADIIDDAVDRAVTAADAKNISLTVDCPADWCVEGNPDLLSNAIRNLVDNAVNYSNAGTQVGIGVRVSDERVFIAVSDQGIGMTGEETERVFERFYRVDPARSRATGGTGLGLSIVKHTVATHGGEVRVWSKPKQGSTFTVVLPLAHTEEHPVIAEAAESGILIADEPEARPGSAPAKEEDGRAVDGTAGRETTEEQRKQTT